MTDTSSALRLGDRAAAIPPSATASLDAYAKELIAAGRDVINLTSGEPAFPTVTPAARAGSKAILYDYTRYTPSAGIPELRQAVAERLVSSGALYRSDQVIITAGAKQALFHAFTALLNPGDEVLVPAPYWVSYPHMLSLLGAVPVVIPYDPSQGSKVTPDQVRKHITSRTRILLLNSPSNPAGAVYQEHELKELGAVAAEHDLAVVSDEICEHLSYGEEPFTSFASLSPELRERTVTIGGFSKTYAMTGWRVGYAAAPAPLVAAMSAIQSHTTSAPCSIAQHAALGALKADLAEELARRRRELDERRRTTLAAIAAMPRLRVEGPADGSFFVLVDVRGTYGTSSSGEVITSAAGFAARLLEHTGVAVVPGADFGAPDHVRLSYTCSTDQLTDGLDRLARFTTALAPVTTPLEGAN